MKTRMCNRICRLILPGIFFSFLMQGQVAQWNFNNNLTGTGSTNVVSANTVVFGSFKATSNENAADLSWKLGVQFRINAELAGVYQFNLYDMNGVKLGVKQINLVSGTQVLNMDNARNKSGIYILISEHAGQRRVTKVAVL
ncbi:MAG: T9SS type A sorting domain-containing protein [Bacteroidota bacterium]|nr:T9SS type A sorting domain-containing protein [Bacteroidota bacterium]MDP4211715.1 T9SS type A sorting domain-containing protein [Bacteroidota bacterium]MDP4250413.1 T9SS type A sorting domain-containing protein [Bacteroidota bacterium]